MKPLEGSIGIKLLDVGLGNDVLDMTLKAQATKQKNKQERLHWTKNFCTAKETIDKVKR